MGLSKSLQEGLPGPLPRAPLEGLQASGAFKGCKATPQPLPGMTGLQGFQAKPLQTAPSDSSGAVESTSNLIEQRDGYDRHAGRPAFGFARPPLRFARGDSSTLTASAPPDTSDRGFGEHQAWRAGKRQSVSHNPWLSSSTPLLTRADDFNRTASPKP